MTSKQLRVFLLILIVSFAAFAICIHYGVLRPVLVITAWVVGPFLFMYLIIVLQKFSVSKETKEATKEARNQVGKLLFILFVVFTIFGIAKGTIYTITELDDDSCNNNCTDVNDPPPANSPGYHGVDSDGDGTNDYIRSNPDNTTTNNINQ